MYSTLALKSHLFAQIWLTVTPEPVLLSPVPVVIPVVIRREVSLELPHVSVLLTFPLAVCGLRRIQTDRKAWLTLIGRESNASSGALISVTCTTGSVNRARLLLAPVITCGRCQLVARSRHWSFRKRQWRDRAYHVNYLNKQ